MKEIEEKTKAAFTDSQYYLNNGFIAEKVLWAGKSELLENHRR